MNETRERIAAHIHTHPGVHFNGLVRALDLGAGQVQYHLKKLCADETCLAIQLYGRTHYYPPEYDAWERGALALLRRETAGDIVAVLFDTGPNTPKEVAETVDIARSTLEWHVDRLVEQDVLEKRRDANGRVTLALSSPAATAELLDGTTSTPSLGARMVDRYMRLLDRFLDG